MPWTCPKCAAALTDNLQACPTCGAVKTSWTLNERKTRNLVVARNRLDVLRGEGKDAPAGDYDGVTWTATTSAPAVTVAAARARLEAGQRPAARDLLLVRAVTKKAAWTLRLTVEFAGKASHTLEVPSNELTQGDAGLELRLLLAYGPDAAALDVPGARVLDVTEGEAAGVTLEVQGPTPRPTRLPIESAWAVAWADPDRPAGADEERLMTLTAPGLPDGADVELEVQREVDGAPSGAPYLTLGQAQGGTLTAQFFTWFVPEGIEQRHLAAGAPLPAVAFRLAANAGGRRVEAAAPLPYSDTLHITFLNGDTLAPLADQAYVLHSPWFTRPGRAGADGMVHEAGLPPGGAMVAFGPAPATEAPADATAWSVAWADPDRPAGADEERLMTLTAPGLPDGADVELEVQREVDGAPSGAPYLTLGQAQGGTLTAQFFTWFVPEGIEQRHLAAGAPLPAVAFRLAANAGGRRVEAAAPLPYSDTLHITFLNGDTLAPLADQAYVLHSPWFTRPGRAGADGMVHEAGLPPGGAMVAFGPAPATEGPADAAAGSVEWADAGTPAGIDTERAMTFTAPDLAAGQEVVFEVQREVDGAPSGAPLEVKATAQAGSASATFSTWFDPNGVQQRHLAAGAALPAVAFRLAARAGARRVEAGAPLPYSDTLHITYMNGDLLEPLASRDFVLHSPWFTRPGRTDADGVAHVEGLPPGSGMVVFGAAGEG